MEHSLSGVGVIDKSLAIVAVLEHSGPTLLADLAAATGFHKATTHRLARAMEHHGLVRRLDDGRYALGYRWLAVAQRVDGISPLIQEVRPRLGALVAQTGESAQFYVRDGAERVCVAAIESDRGLRTIVEVGSRLTLEKGSAGRVLTGETPPAGFVMSIGEREAGVSSISAPVLDASGEVIGALSISGPSDRMGPDAAGSLGPVVRSEADAVSQLIASAG